MYTETHIIAELRPAGFWIRVLAWIIDCILIAALTVPILLAIYGLEFFISTELIKGPVHFLISYVFPVVFTIACWLLWRGTPGKLIFGLRVVDAATGETLALWQAIVRYLGYVVSAIPLMLGYIWVAFDARKQGFHDKLAQSRVVRRNR
jgi:uncharacterized RDD family membrane protein YckC